MRSSDQSESPQRFRLSLRARRLAERQVFPGYLQEHFSRSGSPYDAELNPDGYIALCIAENKLVWDLLRPKLTMRRDVPHRALCYDSMTGSVDFRQRLARFMGRTFLSREFGVDQIAVLAGAGAVLETVFYALGDPDDGVLVPTPSYAGFWADLEARDGLKIVPVHCSSQDGFRLSRSLLDRALAAADRPVKALLFTTPNNPLGIVYTRDEVAEILAWSKERGLHVVFDEIYALSVFGDRPFTSCAALSPSLGDNVHIVWAFSKDFGASGLRCGVLVSENEQLLRIVDGLSYWACCSGDTQWVLGEMISDDDWVDDYIKGSQTLLREAHTSVMGALEEGGIPFLSAEAGLFLLCDLRPFMPEVTWEAETGLWRRFLDHANVNLTPGSSCRVCEPGFMRLCYAGQPVEVTVEGVKRLRRILGA